jgi:hypothetical protein
MGGCSRAHSSTAELGVPVAAGEWHRHANNCGLRVAEMANGHGGAARGGGTRFRGVGSGWPRLPVAKGGSRTPTSRAEAGVPGSGCKARLRE